MADQKAKKPTSKTTATKTPRAAEKTPKAAAAPQAAAPEVKAAVVGPSCRIDKCKQAVRAKGYCRKHYFGWRRGALGDKHRYKTCSKEACRKKAVFAGRCEEHKKSATSGGESAAPAAA